MSHLLDSANSPVSWQYPSTGSAPPTPVVVNTVPEYFGGRPTPPPSPLKVRATCTTDDYAPCPPTPRCVPSCAQDDAFEWSDAHDSGPPPPTSSEYWSTSELDHSTVFMDPLIDLASNDSDDDAPHVSDCLIYDLDTYATPNVVLTMIDRAALDEAGLGTRPIDPWTSRKPHRLFSLTAGIIPLTGLEKYDEQSFDYYSLPLYASLSENPERSLPYYFSIGTIQALQHELRTEWLSVYPRPIPPVIIRSHDLIGPHYLSRRDHGYAYVVPSEDSIWPTVRQRGIDSSFRPISPLAKVETSHCNKGAAWYHPQHVVASKFAVNVFLELPDSEGLGPTPPCEYLGAYMLQVVDGVTITRSVWADIDPEVQKSVFRRIPDRFEGSKHPSHGWPLLPCVRFCYYGWDKCFIKFADDFRDRNVLWMDQGDTESERVDSDDPWIYLDPYSDPTVNQDTASTPNAYSPEPDYTSFLDLS